jgi:molybdopterin/thiamine biosynthesis adenylyltransferase
MRYRPWYERFPDRLNIERLKMSERGFTLDEQALSSERRVRFFGKSENLVFNLTIEYPDAFPSKPPRVFSQPTDPLLARHHRADNREICTFGPQQIQWRANLSGGKAIDQAEAVISDAHSLNDSEKPLKEIQVDVPEPASAKYIYPSATYVLVPPTIAQFAGSLPEGASAKVNVRFSNWPGHPVSQFGSGRGVVSEARTATKSIQATAFYRELGTGLSVSNLRVSIIRLAEPPPFVSEEKLAKWVNTFGNHNWIGFIFPEETGNSQTLRLGWVFARRLQKGRFEYTRTFVMDGSGQNARMPRLRSLAENTIVMIGCGSLGSKIAVQLAATGVSRFGLVDFDYMEPDNSVRHEAGVDSFGIPKPWAVYRRLVTLNPDVAQNIKTMTMVIGGMERSEIEAGFQEMLASASIVIDTTGDHGVSRLLNDLCGEFGVPQVYASVTNGARSGEIVRVVPGKTACWMCWLTQFEHKRPSEEPAPSVGVFAPGCDQPTFTGTTYDIGVVASLAASFVVDTLLLADANRAHYKGDYLLWQLKDKDGAFEPRVEVLPSQKRDTCPFCESQ